MGAASNSLKAYVLVDGAQPYVRVPVTEYAAPVRLGPADYDARQVASTVAFVDMAGGGGKYLPDTRNDANRWWLSSCDTRFQGQIALLPKWTAASLPNQPSGTGGAASLVFSNVNATNRLYAAAGDRLYSTTGTAWSNTVQKAAGAGIQTYRLRDLVVVNATPAAVNYLFWARSDNAYVCSADPTVAGNHVAMSTVFSMPAADNPVDALPAPENVSRALIMLTSGRIITSDLAAGTNTDQGFVSGGGHFIGAMQGSVYGIDGSGRLFGYNPTLTSGERVQSYPDALPLCTGGAVLQNAQLAITDGRRVLLWHPTRPSREITPGGPDGFPVTMAVGSKIRGLFTIGDRLLCLADLTSSTKHVLMEFRGGGWHVWSKQLTGTWMGPTTIDATFRLLSDTGFGFDPKNNRHWLVDIASGTVGSYYNTLPAGGDNPYVQEIVSSGDGFEGTGCVLETGWHHMGFRGLSGPFLGIRLLGEMPDTNCSVAFSYRTDFDEISSWTPIATLDSVTRSATIAAGGAGFRVIRFNIAPSQTGGSGGGTSNKSPNCGFSVDFLKVPNQLYRRTWQIDLNATASRRRKRAEDIVTEIHNLAKQTSSNPAVSFAGEGTLYMKLEGPREQSYSNPQGELVGVMTVSGVEPI